MLVKYGYKDHFYELKRRMQLCLGFLFIAFLFGYYYKKIISNILLAPLLYISNTHLIYTSLPESFLAHLNIAFFTGFVFSLPFLSYQIYLFVAPGLYAQEKKIFRSILLAAPLLFWLACAFVYFLIIPIACKFFLSFSQAEGFNVSFQGKIEEYFSLIVKLMLSFGAVFELPVALIILFLLKIVTLEGMIKRRRIFIVISFIIAGILTPPDVVTQFMLAVPMCLLYEAAIVICKRLDT